MLDLPITQDENPVQQDFHEMPIKASWVGVRSNFQHSLFKGRIPFLERNKSFKWLKMVDPPHPPKISMVSKFCS